MLPTAANLTLLQENRALASQHQVMHNANQPFIMKREAKQQDDMEAMQAKVNGLCSIMQTVVETVEQLSSLSSSGSGGGSAKIERNESPERKEQDAQNTVDSNHENKPNTAESWEQAAYSANTGKPQVQGFDYTNPTTGTRVICLHQLKSMSFNNRS